MSIIGAVGQLQQGLLSSSVGPSCTDDDTHPSPPGEQDRRL
jgi:hypothetical protein